MAKIPLTQTLSEPLDGAKTALIDINVGTGNLAIDTLTGGEPVLAAGTLEYLENQDPPRPSVSRSNGQASLALKASGGRTSLIRLPWAACNGETEWQIHLNPAVQSEIIAHSGGGNVKLDLAGMDLTCVSTDTGGGNVEVMLPDGAANLQVTARTGGGNVTVELGRGVTGTNSVIATSGAGNVTIRVPEGIAAWIHATSGMGKVIVDPRFSQIDGNTYRSPDYDTAADKLEITLKSGAGNVSVASK